MLLVETSVSERATDMDFSHFPHNWDTLISTRYSPCLGQEICIMLLPDISCICLRVEDVIYTYVFISSIVEEHITSIYQTLNYNSHITITYSIYK